MFTLINGFSIFKLNPINLQTRLLLLKNIASSVLCSHNMSCGGDCPNMLQTIVVVSFIKFCYLGSCSLEEMSCTAIVGYFEYVYAVLCMYGYNYTNHDG